MPQHDANHSVELKQRASFVADALAAREEMLTTGMGYDADEVHAYLGKRIAAELSARPTPVLWRC